MFEIRFSKLAVILNCAIPLVLLGWDAWHQSLGANPVNFAIRTTGLLALICLLLTLAITPVAKLLNWQQIIPLRRTFGVYAFVHTAVHFLIYFTFDRALGVGSTFYEISMRLYLTVGFIGLLIMLPLAITSTNGMIKRLGPQRWKLLHRLTYVAAIAGAWHYYLLVKADIVKPLIFATILVCLLLYRVLAHYWKLRQFYTQSLQNATAPLPAATLQPVTSLTTKNWTGQLTVAKIFQETPDVRTFRLVWSQQNTLPFDYLPGQFLTLNLNIDGQKVKRSYTIASSPSSRGYCELTVKREAQGQVSRYLHDQIQPGDQLQVTAPSGKFTFDGEVSKSLVCIAGGVGITPLMSKIRYLTDVAWDGTIYLIYSAKTADDLIFAEELNYLAQRHDNLKLCITLSRPEQSWTGRCGRISLDLLREFVPNLATQPIHICGPNELNQAVKTLLLDAGIPANHIRQESFGSGKPKSPAIIAGTQVADAPAPAEHQVEFARSSKNVQINGETTILEAAEQAQVRLDYDCRAGVCGTCKVRLLKGQVTLDNQSALDPSERVQGFILSCQARCLGDVTIQA